MAWWLGHLISNPEVLILKPLGGSNVDSAFYPFEFLVPGIPGDFVVKSILSPRSGSIALRQLNPFHKKGPQSFKNFHDQCNILTPLNHIAVVITTTKHKFVCCDSNVTRLNFIETYLLKNL